MISIRNVRALWAILVRYKGGYGKLPVGLQWPGVPGRSQSAAVAAAAVSRTTTVAARPARSAPAAAAPAVSLSPASQGC